MLGGVDFSFSSGSPALISGRRRDPRRRHRPRLLVERGKPSNFAAVPVARRSITRAGLAVISAVVRRVRPSHLARHRAQPDQLVQLGLVASSDDLTWRGRVARSVGRIASCASCAFLALV
jgi:hypothetical protein